MRQLTQPSQQALEEIAARHGFSVDAARSMLDAVLAGNGRMAQFDHPEFGGSGQWMSGGMTMVSDLFDDRLKGRVAALCRDLSELAARAPGSFDRGGSVQSPREKSGDGGAQQQSQGGGAPAGAGGSAPNRLFDSAAPGGSRHWWPDDLDSPSSSGSQNDMRYAFFPKQRRLAIEDGGRLTVYDTQDHRIDGVSQQQSGSRSATFTSQHGNVDLASLRVVSTPDDAARGAPAHEPSAPPQQQQQKRPRNPPASGAPAADDVYSAIEKLASLKAKGILSEEEFAAKKAELLSRI